MVVSGVLLAVSVLVHGYYLEILRWWPTTWEIATAYNFCASRVFDLWFALLVIGYKMTLAYAVLCWTLRPCLWKQIVLREWKKLDLFNMLRSGYCSRYSWAVRISKPSGSERLSLLHSPLDWPWDPSSPLCCVFPGGRGGGSTWSVVFVTHPHLASNLSISTAIPLLLPCAPIGMLRGDLYLLPYWDIGEICNCKWKRFLIRQLRMHVFHSLFLKRTMLRQC
jgi:hypothetical protein